MLGSWQGVFTGVGTHAMGVNPGCLLLRLCAADTCRCTARSPAGLHSDRRQGAPQCDCHDRCCTKENRHVCRGCGHDAHLCSPSPTPPQTGEVTQPRDVQITFLIHAHPCQRGAFASLDTCHDCHDFDHPPEMSFAQSSRLSTTSEHWPDAGSGTPCIGAVGGLDSGVVAEDPVDGL